METQEEDVVKATAKLPLSERTSHKNWRVREAAYRELADKFRVAEENAKIYSEFATTLVKLARDANAPAQLVGFDALSTFADTAPPPLVKRVAPDIIKGIVEKGLAGRPTNKTKAVESFLMFVGADVGDIAIDVMTAIGFKHKTPKVVAAAVDAVTSAVDTYGIPASPVKPISSRIPPLLNHSQEIVRNAAKALVIMLHAWVGNAIKVVLKDAKDVTVKELEAAFAKHASSGRPKPKKLTRSMEERVRNTVASGGNEDEDDGFDDGEVQDEEELDLAEEINLMEKLATVKITVEEGVTQNWTTAIESKKWNARKDALDAVVNLIGDAKLIPVSHHEIFVRIRKILAKDSNVNVVASSAKLVKAMAGGMKKTFPPGAAKGITVDLLGRLKEKNRIVVDAVSVALDALHQKKCLNICELLEEINEAAKHKVPKARCETLQWLGRCILNGMAPSELKGAPLKSFGVLFLKATDDSAPEVRDAGLAGLAGLRKLVGERNVGPYIEKLDKKRRDKIAAIMSEIPDPKPSSGASKKKSTAPVNEKKVSKKKSSTSPSKATPEKAKKAVPKQTKSLKATRRIEESDDEGESSLSSESALATAAEKFEGFEAENWSVKSFKARSAAAELILTPMREKEKLEESDILLIIGLLQNPPGLADSNFIAAKPKLELFRLVTEKCPSPPPRKSLKPLLLCAMEKLGDIKSAKVTAEILMSFAETTSPRFVLTLLLQTLKETKNSRATIGMLKFASSVVEDFGIPMAPTQLVASIAVGFLGNAAPAAHSSAMTLACKAASGVGSDSFRTILEKEGCSQENLEAFDTEMAKYTRSPDPPTRKKKFSNMTSIDQEEQKESEPIIEEETKPIAKSPAREEVKTKPTTKQVKRRITTPETSPVKQKQVVNPVVSQTKTGTPVRVSIAQEFAPGSRIFLDLKNSNWKKRQDALNTVMSTIEQANNCIKPNVGNEIIAALRARLNDTNRNLAATAYEVVTRMIRAMGQGGAVHLKILAPAALGHGCVDIKKVVREAAMKCLSGWFEVFGLLPLLPYCNLPLISINSGVRKDFLEWLVPRLQGDMGSFDAKHEDLSVLVDPCLSCLRDRTVEVRHLADLTLEQVVKSVGIGVIDSKLASSTKSVRLQLEPILEKYRGAPGNSSSQTMHQPGTAAKAPVSATPKVRRERPKSVAVPKTPMQRRGLTGPGHDATPGTGGRRQRPMSARVTPVSVHMNRSHAMEDESVQYEPPLKDNHNRETRAARYLSRRSDLIDELSGANMRDEIPPLMGEDIEDIAEDLSACCSSELYIKLTAPANRFRMHVEAIEMISKQLEDNPDVLLSVSDVLLRWSACRIEDSKTPPTVLIKLAEFVSNMCEVLMSSGIKLGDYESSAILPPVVAKCGSNRDAVRETMRSCLLSIEDIVEEDTLLVLFTSCLRQPVSYRAHSDVATEISHLIDKRCRAGAGIPPGVLPVIGRVAGGEDDAAGRAAATCLERAHDHFGDDLWGLVGDLTNEEAALLDDRLTSVINGIRDDDSQIGDETEVTEKDFTAGEEEIEDLSAQPPPQPFPSDIRNEDFRLSVAPAPPKQVLNSITESIQAETPQRTNFRAVGNLQTPSLVLKGRRLAEEYEADENMVADIIERLQNKDRDVQLSGLASIFDNLKDSGSLLGSNRGPELLLLLVRCFGETLQRLETGARLEDDPAVLKSFLKGVIRFAREPTLLRRLDQTSVEVLLSDALNAMIPQIVKGVDDWDQVRRGVNLMIVKVLESCDQNVLFTAMINLLLVNIRLIQRIPNEKVSSLAKSSICIKSLAKVAKRGFANCRLNALLRDIHLFLMANPVRRDGQASAEDQTFAMRLLKTLVDSVIDEIGPQIRKHLDLIPQPEKSQLIHYIDMTLADQGQPTITSDADGLSAGLFEPSMINIDENKELQAILFNIMNGDKSQHMVNMLISFVRTHPEVDIASNLEGCSFDTRQFVTEHMRYHFSGHTNQNTQSSNTIDSQEHTSLSNSEVSSMIDENKQRSVDGQQEAITDGATQYSAGQVYLKRLHEIQLRYGLKTANQTNTERGSTEDITGDNFGQVGEKENGSGDKVPTAEEARGKAYSLRERMARIRELQSASKE